MAPCWDICVTLKYFKFCPKMSAFASAAYIQVHYRLDFFMEANNMNPDKTASIDGFFYPPFTAMRDSIVVC